MYKYDIVEFVENIFGIKLFNYQKIILKSIEKCDNLIYYLR